MKWISLSVQNLWKGSICYTLCYAVNSRILGCEYSRTTKKSISGASNSRRRSDLPCYYTLCQWKDEPMLPPAWASFVIPPGERKTEHTQLPHRTPYWDQATTTHGWKLKFTDRCINMFYWGTRLPRFWVMVSTCKLLPCNKYQAYFFSCVHLSICFFHDFH